jgi:hypothetical protein
VGGKAVAIFAVGKAPTNGQAFDEAVYTVGGLAVTGGAIRSHTTGAAAVRTSPQGAGPVVTRY